MLLTAAALPLAGQEPQLGTITFPTSGASQAQPLFVRGVLYLHSFEYASALRAFREARSADPGFVMAYWGEALAHTHPVWNEQDLDSARAVLARLGPMRADRLARAATARERAYLDAVETLYGDGSKPRRDTLYARAMLRMVEDFPDDPEARTFAALAVLGLNQGVRDFGAYMQAAALAQPVFERNPDHPGAAHYLIHAFDDPLHAVLGLPAAHAYSRIAPDAAHAQHMTTHIFLARGMWDLVESQNTIAVARTSRVPGHYTLWEFYAVLQQGRFQDALALLERARGAMTAGGEGRLMQRTRQATHLVLMRGHWLIETERWAGGPADWELGDSAPYAGHADAFVRGYAALRRGDRATAMAMAAELTREAAAGRDSPALVMERELRAMLRMADGAGEEAVTLLREAAAMEDALPAEFGPPGIVKPSHELLGEVLLARQRPGEAQHEFARALALAPGRARALAGLVRAAAAAGDREVAATTLRQLEASWRRADGDAYDLTALRQLVAMR